MARRQRPGAEVGEAGIAGGDHECPKSPFPLSSATPHESRTLGKKRFLKPKHAWTIRVRISRSLANSSRSPADQLRNKFRAVRSRRRRSPRTGKAGCGRDTPGEAAASGADTSVKVTAARRRTSCGVRQARGRPARDASVDGSANARLIGSTKRWLFDPTWSLRLKREFPSSGFDHKAHGGFQLTLCPV